MLGFIGIGKQSSGHLNRLSGMATTQVVAVCDVHTGRRERAKKSNEAKYERLERKASVDQYVDYHELFARKDIDAVVIGVPDHWHAAIAMSAAIAGKDIYCEKPRSGPVEVIPPPGENDKYGAQVIYRGSKVGDDIVVTHKNVVYEGTVKNRNGEPRHIRQDNGITFIGELGKIFVNRMMIVSEPYTILKEPIHEDEIQYYKSPGHFQNWMNCIKTGQRPIANVEIGARSVTVCHLINLAYWHHRKLTWDPHKWEFPGDAEANAWRDRERREKYQLPKIQTA